MKHATTLPRESVHFHEVKRAIEAAPRDRLPEVAAMLWRAFGEGRVSEAEAESLSALIEARKAPAAIVKPLRIPVGSRPRTDASMERRRRWAASGRLPPGIAAKFTLAETAVLAVVALEISKRGDCRLALDHIAAVAGVSRATVRNALKQARLVGVVTVEERRLSRWRSDTNVVRIVSKEWLSWMRLARRQDGGGGGRNCLSGTDTVVSSKGRQRAASGGKGASGIEIVTNNPARSGSGGSR